MYKYDDYSSRKEYSEEELIYTELIYEDDVPESFFRRLTGIGARGKNHSYAPNRRVLSNLTLLSIILLSTTLVACGSSKVAGTVSSISDLPGKNVGVILNSLADVEATDLEVGGDGNDPSYVVRYNTLEEGLTDLESGDLDCMILEDFQANSCLEDHEDLIVLDESFSFENYTICLAKSNKDLRKEINDAIASLQKDGTMEKIAQEFEDPDNVETTVHENEATTVDKDTLVVATSAGYSPYCYSDSEDNLTGIDIETIYTIGSKLGKNIYLVNMDYESMFDSLKEGTVDVAIAGIEMNDELDSSFDCIHTDSYASAVQTVLARSA